MHLLTQTREVRLLKRQAISASPMVFDCLWEPQFCMFYLASRKMHVVISETHLTFLPARKQADQLLSSLRSYSSG
jgi:hypothetical protein